MNFEFQEILSYSCLSMFFDSLSILSWSHTLFSNPVYYIARKNSRFGKINIMACFEVPFFSKISIYEFWNGSLEEFVVEDDVSEYF